jgi:putative oxidoreductase
MNSSKADYHLHLRRKATMPHAFNLPALSVGCTVPLSGEIASMPTAQFYAQWCPRVLSVLRILTALLFMEHGMQKLLGFPPSPNPAPPLFSLLGVQGMLELAGGFLLLIGLFTRPVAFILSGDMAVAYFMAHAPRSFFPTLNGGDAAILFCFVFLYLAVAGGGVRSLDEFRRRANSPAV